MIADKYSAIWVSHSSIRDFLACPRAYYLKNVYKDPKTGHKVQLISPPLSLGSVVHVVVEALSVLPVTTRFNESLIDKFDIAWQHVTGKKGGFLSSESEQIYKNRGLAMLKRIITNPGPLKNLAIKIKEDLPHFWLSEDENIILCGKIDWLEYLPKTDSVHIIDFKTGKIEEDGTSLQLLIYHLLVHYCQRRTVSKASYWYLESQDTPVEKQLHDLAEAKNKVLEVAKQIKVARKLERYKCTQITGCSFCKPYEKILQGEAELVGVNDYNQDMYILKSFEEGEESILL